MVMVPVHAVIECPACEVDDTEDCDRCGGARFVAVKPPPPAKSTRQVIAEELQRLKRKSGG